MQFCDSLTFGVCPKDTEKIFFKLSTIHGPANLGDVCDKVLHYNRILDCEKYKNHSR